MSLAFETVIRRAARQPCSHKICTPFRPLKTPIKTTKAQLISAQTRARSTCTPVQRWTRLRAALRTPQSRKYSSKPTPDVTSQLGSPAPRLGLRDKLKELFKKYGYLSVGVYLAFSVLDFPFCYLAVRLAGPERIGQIEHQILSSLKGVTEPVWQVIKPVAGPAFDAISDTISRIRDGAVKTAGADQLATPDTETGHKSGSASIWTQLALAYGIHKTLLIFVRVPLTAAFTPRIARALQKRGWKIGSSSKPRSQ